MRTKVMITMAVVALAAATAGTAWAQNPGPTKEMTAAVAYDTLLSGNINGTVQGVAVHVDRPAWSYVTVAFGGSFVTGGGGDKINPIGSIGASRVYAGAGPGIRYPVGETGRTEVYGHILLGYIRQQIDYGGQGGLVRSGSTTETGYSERVGGGLDYAMNDRLRLRVGIDYDGEAHFLGGMALRF